MPLNSADSSTIVGDGEPFFLVSFYHGVDDRFVDRLPMPVGASDEGIDVCPPLSVQMQTDSFGFMAKNVAQISTDIVDLCEVFRHGGKRAVGRGRAL